jgi:hypothetical protein
VHNIKPNPARHAYTFGGVARVNQSASKDVLNKDQFGLLQSVNRN